MNMVYNVRSSFYFSKLNTLKKQILLVSSLTSLLSCLISRLTIQYIKTPGIRSKVPVSIKRRKRNKSITCLSTMLIILGTMSSLASGDVTLTLVSEDLAGSQGNNDSRNASINADGQLVAFSSLATNLVPDVTNSTFQVYVKNIITGEIVLASVSATGEQGNGLSGVGAGTGLSISSEGRFVAFVTDATNLVPIDTDDVQVLVKNLQTGELVRVTENVAGEPGNNDSFSPSISADGTFVAFESRATNLVPVDTADPPAPFVRTDVFVKNIVTGEIIQASTDATGLRGNRSSGVVTDDTGNLGINVSISADGRFVAFPSRATNLVPDDTNEALDVFVKNIMSGEIVRVSEDSTGIQANRRSGDSGISISDDGQSVAFTSFATNLVSDDTNNALDLFVKNLETGMVERVSENAAGEQGNGDSLVPSLSSDGRFVAFASFANNLVADDTNGFTDIFVKNVETGAIVRVADSAFRSSISDNGRFVAFSSFAANLVLDDTNDSEDVFLADVDIGQAPAAPVNLRAVVYSRTAAELFWDRPVGQAFLYRVYFNGVLVAETDGVSWFSEDFTPGSVTTVEVAAVDRNGVESAPSEVIVQTHNGGLRPVTGLRAEVYSSTAAEIFWDRMPGPIHYRVYANGVEVAITDGTSWFSDIFEPGSTTELSVATFDGTNESEPRSVTLTTRGSLSEEPISGVPAVNGLR